MREKLKQEREKNKKLETELEYYKEKENTEYDDFINRDRRE